MFRNDKILCFFGLCFLLPLSLYATATMECKIKTMYFDVLFVGNYGSPEADTIFQDDLIAKTNVIIRVDSLLRYLKRTGKIGHFKRWLLIDDYTKSYDWVKLRKIPKQLQIRNREVYLCLSDSISLNKALKKLWGIEDVVISPHKTAAMWLFSLHVGLAKSRKVAELFFQKVGISSDRPDSYLLWLQIEGGLCTSHQFCQHEKDGYYHTYTGLYLTKNDCLEAQKLLLSKMGLKTTVVSQYITPRIISKYASAPPDHVWNCKQ